MDHPLDRDSIGLVRRFAEKKSSRFEDFKTEWLKCKFYYMHCLRNDCASKGAVVERIFDTMVDVLVNKEADPFERIGSLYLCYSLYCTQFGSESCKIRIELKDFDTIGCLHGYLRSSGLHDADYVFCRLKSLSAFIYCATQRKKCMGQQADGVLNSELTLLNERPALESGSDLMAGLKTCQQLLGGYESVKESISDHLPLNLVTKSNFIDEFLDEERLKIVKEGGEVDTPTQLDPEIELDEDSEINKLRLKQFSKAPQRIGKLK